MKANPIQYKENAGMPIMATSEEDCMSSYCDYNSDVFKE